MFSRKYNVTILNSKWEFIKKNIKLNIVPRKGEYLFIENQYYEIMIIVHNIIDEKQGIFLIVEPVENIFKKN